jgi:hypothetical protein
VDADPVSKIAYRAYRVYSLKAPHILLLWGSRAKIQIQNYQVRWNRVRQQGFHSGEVGDNSE